MSSRGVCTNCGGSDIDTDPARGSAVCTGCGSVLEDQIIVSEVQFQDNAMGGSSVIGQYVSAEGNKSHSLGSGFHHGIGKESRQITLENAKRRIQQVGDKLRLNQHCMDTAFNFFKMALNRRLTRGRRNTHVVAACLYIVCRTEATPHMLLDFSDVLEVDVYALGRTYLQLSRELCINIPVLDPCLYIQRFAHSLEFGDRTHEVCMTALRLVSRMKTDWMAYGRRPSGLCGAALLVSARIHNFNRTIKEIIKVVRIGEGTIRKRLSEFEQTPSSQLTIEEFQKIDLEEEMDPPCFTKGRKKAKISQLEDQGQLPEKLKEELAQLQSQIEAAIEEAVNKKNSRYKKYLTESSPETTSVSVPDDLCSSECQKFIEQETLKSVFLDAELTPELADTSVSLMEKIETTELEPADTKEVKEVSRIVSPSTSCVPTSEESMKALGPRPTAASLGLTGPTQEPMKVGKEEETSEQDGELDLAGIDDEEIDSYILSVDDMKHKARMWFTTNADYLKEMKEKEEKEARDRELGIIKPEQKKKKRARKKAKAEANTAGEAIEKMLAEKKISSKINYDVLKDLNSPSMSGSMPNTPLKVEPRLVEPSKTMDVSVSALGNRFKRPSILVDAKEESSPIKKPKILGETPKNNKNEDSKVEEAAEVDVIVESGPVEYHDASEHDDEEEEEDYDDEPVSAAKLMGHHTADDEDYGDDYYDE